MATIQAEERSIDNGNGHLISSYWYQPNAAPRGAVLIAPAMGVKQRFYAAFATWLATRGYLVVTFDYLGMGRSRRIPLRQLQVDILDWDAPAPGFGGRPRRGPATTAVRCSRR